MNSLFSNSDTPDTPSAPDDEVDESKLSRSERKRLREEKARQLLGPATDALSRRGRGDKDMMDGGRDYRLVPIADVQEDSDNPRTVYKNVDELAKNLKENQLEQPIKCWVDRKGGLHLKDGHRRIRAAKLAGWTHIPALIEYTEGQKLRQQVSANIHHEQMNAVDEGHALKRMMREEKIATEKQLADSLGKSLGWVNLRMQLTRMTKEEQQAIKDGHLAYTEAIKRRKQGRDILTGDWINGSGVIGGFAGGVRPSGDRPSLIDVPAKQRFPRGPEATQAGGASIQRITPNLTEAEQAEDEAAEANTKAETRERSGHFNEDHELAFRVSHRCGNHGRPSPQIGGVGCGECWEYIIRTDERILTKSSMRTAKG